MIKRELPTLVHGGDANLLATEFDYEDLVGVERSKKIKLARVVA